MAKVLRLGEVISSRYWVYVYDLAINRSMPMVIIPRAEVRLVDCSLGEEVGVAFLWAVRAKHAA